MTFRFATSLRDEAPTLALWAVCHVLWAGLTVGGWPAWLTILALSVVLALHSSLQHELLHGHPFADRRINAAMGSLALGLAIPYGRFRDLHIAHHLDERLTDPYDDPESNFLDPADWARLSPAGRALMRANNTLLGRMTIGPAIGLWRFWSGEFRAAMSGDRAVAAAWGWHALGLAPVLLWLWQVGAVPLWAYLLACYGALGLLKIRTFLEHRADADPARRTAVVEDAGPLALLFLNNNFHAVHHAQPKLPWVRLPAAYRAEREAVLARNGGYRYASYAEVARRHLLRAKDPVPHPLGRAPAPR